MNGSPAPLGVPQDILNNLNMVDSIINSLANDPSIQPQELRRIQSQRMQINDLLTRYKEDSENLLKRYNDQMQNRINQLNDLIERSRRNG